MESISLLTQDRITTYGEVRSQWITPEEMKSVTRQYKTDRKGFQRELFKRLGALFGIQWYRVILDEAHAIKNIKAQSEFPFLILQNSDELLIL